MACDPSSISSIVAKVPGILQCPVCCHALNATDRCGVCETNFPQVEGLPVLIDFADSIFTPADYAQRSGGVATRVQKGGRAGKFLTDLTYGKDELPARASFLNRLRNGAKVLVIGGGSVGDGMKALYSGKFEVIGTDIYPSPNVSLICDGHKLPFVSETFDAVVIQAVLEHVVEPNVVVAEVHRVLKSSGFVFAETPFMQQVHEGAYDFTRFTMSGHRWLFRAFDEINAGVVQGPGTALLWSIGYFVRSIGCSQRMATLITATFFWVRKLERRNRLWRDAASGVYFLGSKSAGTMQANQLPAYYADKD